MYRPKKLKTNNNSAMKGKKNAHTHSLSHVKLSKCCATVRYNYLSVYLAVEQYQLCTVEDPANCAISAGHTIAPYLLHLHRHCSGSLIRTRSSRCADEEGPIKTSTPLLLNGKRKHVDRNCHSYRKLELLPYTVIELFLVRLLEVAVI